MTAHFSEGKHSGGTMKLFDKKVSTGWSFVLGMFFGALLIFAKIGPSSVMRVSGHVSPRPAMDLSAHGASISPPTDRTEANGEPSPAVSVRAKSRAEKAPSRETHHSECELQLD